MIFGGSVVFGGGNCYSSGGLGDELWWLHSSTAAKATHSQSFGMFNFRDATWLVGWLFDATWRFRQIIALINSYTKY